MEIQALIGHASSSELALHLVGIQTRDLTTIMAQCAYDIIQGARCNPIVQRMEGSDWSAVEWKALIGQPWSAIDFFESILLYSNM